MHAWSHHKRKRTNHTVCVGRKRTISVGPWSCTFHLFSPQVFWNAWEVRESPQDTIDAAVNGIISNVMELEASIRFDGRSGFLPGLHACAHVKHGRSIAFFWPVWSMVVAKLYSHENNYCQDAHVGSEVHQSEKRKCTKFSIQLKSNDLGKMTKHKPAFNPRLIGYTPEAVRCGPPWTLGTPRRSRYLWTSFKLRWDLSRASLSLAGEKESAEATALIAARPGNLILKPRRCTATTGVFKDSCIGQATS